MELKNACEKLQQVLTNQQMGILIGECFVKYDGRASSRLRKGKRLILIKADNSISIHENRLIRPTNYMMNTKIKCFVDKNELKLIAKRIKPKEVLEIKFYSVDAIHGYNVPMSNDLRLSGSERELNEALMEDLSFLEPGLKPINQQEVFRTGVCDIVAEDAEGKLVVIELKRRKADYASVTQLKRYADQVEKLKGIETRGILLAPEIRKSAMELLQSYGLEYYSYDFKVGEQSTIKGIEKKQKRIMEY